MLIPIEFIISGVGLISTLLVIYNNFERKSVMQSTNLENLKLKVEFLEKSHAEHGKRLDDQEQQNKALIALTEQIRTLTDDVKELKSEIRKKGEL
ncbi:DUF7365 family protein [Streptococcus hyovaginalis]|uniref:DUF7365 family protein n=1 Tax=Streptococcus hyovaginalis TaxID=149015 RepID=UPI003BF7CC8C